MSFVHDGFYSLAAGMNESTASDAIDADEYVRGVNVDIRDGKPKTRPRFQAMTLTGVAGTLTAFAAGKFQGAARYRYGGVDYLIACVSGGVYRIDPRDWSLVVATETLLPTVDRVYFCQADEYMIVQDGTTPPVIIHGDASRYSVTDTLSEDEPEVPVGTIMAYGQGRLFVTRAGKYIEAGDITKSWDTGSLLVFSETVFLNGGGMLGMPGDLGEIRGLAFQQNVVSGTGEGNLLAFCERGVASFAVSNSRTTWNSSVLGKVLFANSGAASHSVVPVNNDLFFRGRDGLRSLRYSATLLTGDSTVLENAPQGDRAREILHLDPHWTLPLTSGALHGNRYFLTTWCVESQKAGPYAENVCDFAFRGLLVADLLAPSDNEQDVAFAGVWTGLHFTQPVQLEVNGQERLALFAQLAQDHENVLYLLSEDDTLLGDGLAESNQPPLCRLYTRAFHFVASSDSDQSVRRKSLHKTFHYADVWFSGIAGTAHVRLLCRPRGYPLWTECGRANLRADMANDSGEAWPHNRQKVRFTAPESANDPATFEPTLTGCALEFCLEWDGVLTVERVLVGAELASETANVLDPDTPPAVLSGSALMDDDYVMEVL